MHRRRLLALAAGSLAGCSGRLGGGTTPSPPRLVGELSGPASVRLGESATLTLAVENRGGTTGDVRGEVVAFEGLRDEVSRSVSASVAPGGRRRFEVSVPTRYAGDWPVAFVPSTSVDPDPGASASSTSTTTGTDTGAVDDAGTRADPGAGTRPLVHRLEVRPSLGRIGDVVEFVGGFALSVRSATVRTAFEYRYYDDPPAVSTARPGWTYLFARVAVENRGQQRVGTPGRSEFVAFDGDGVYPIHLTRVPWRMFSVRGEPYPLATSLDPGESLRGWLPFEVREPGPDGRLAVGWNRDREGTPPEAVWDLPREG